ncbi:hypothetical protein [Candidatus Regiella insecticola]|nr:hypothetical protein [Candidatus Regiella insecticola]
MNDALNSRYLMKLILLANKPEAIHSIRLSILKTEGGLFINPASSRNSLFNHNPLKVDPLLGAAYSKDLAVVMAKKDSLFIDALFEHEAKIKAVLAAFTGIQDGNTLSKTLFNAIQSHLRANNI